MGVAKSVLEPIEDGRKLNKGKEGASEFVVESADATIPLDAAEEVFDAMTAAIKRAGEGA